MEDLDGAADRKTPQDLNGFPGAAETSRLKSQPVAVICVGADLKIVLHDRSVGFGGGRLAVASSEVFADTGVGHASGHAWPRHAGAEFPPAAPPSHKSKDPRAKRMRGAITI